MVGLVMGVPRLSQMLRPTSSTRNPRIDSRTSDRVNSSGGRTTASGKQAGGSAAGEAPIDPAPWQALGYEPLDRGKLENAAIERDEMVEELPAGLVNAPAGLRRHSNKAVFYAFAPGVYLPLGYRAEDSKALHNSRPKVIVRSSDKARFMFIEGGKYTRGDFRATAPVSDFEGNACTAHDVEVADFYIQETEVTDGEIREFAKKHPDVSLKKWREGDEFLRKQKPATDVVRSPAVFIDRATAQQYAQGAGGRLPTEAEWEYAARSCGQKNLWAWKNAAGKRGNPKAYLLTSASAEPFPVPVGTFRGEDETDQGVLDMTGNVREWCLDVYTPYDKIIAEQQGSEQVLSDPKVGGEPDPNGPQLRYVVRGGCS